MWFVAPVPPLTPVIHEGAEGGSFAREEDGGLLRGGGTQAIDLWAVHTGGRTILDAVHNGFTLGDKALAASRAVLAEHGNMSSAAVMLVLKPMLNNSPRGKRDRATAFGPGVVAQTFRFSLSGQGVGKWISR
jgi:predicted naringenin-chalcone synthase